MHPCLTRARSFTLELGIETPLLLAPMAGACPVPLSAAVAAAGGLGACGALLMPPDQITDWARRMRATSNGGFQMNLWIPDPAPARNPAHEAEMRAHLAQWGPDVPAEAADVPLQDFHAQCQAMLQAGPTAISSIMGLYPPDFVAQMKARGIKWFANATTVAEARAAEAAGADVIIAQGMEAGGHRGAFEAADAATAMVGLFALLPAVVDAVSLPVVATGGIADARGIAAALLLGASGVQIGTGFLRTPEAQIAPVWADAIGRAAPEDTIATAAFSGRLGRSIRTAYTTADAPDPAPYPVQRALTAPMRAAAVQAGNIDAMQAWAGQSARLAQAEPADQLTARLWRDACALLA
ncbi:NAD(P)H-dependent flavin oxidoreductase [Sedimentitalea sp. HM32M-2]|uniref:NAD(P)H-dependent flavin oxidoreductase n=1 Tax=Sedimentitalea sp. HM32M-2 TaxID=3351566 RepID=UPI00363EC4DD